MSQVNKKNYEFDLWLARHEWCNMIAEIEKNTQTTQIGNCITCKHTLATSKQTSKRPQGKKTHNQKQHGCVKVTETLNACTHSWWMTVWDRQGLLFEHRVHVDVWNPLHFHVCPIMVGDFQLISIVYSWANDILYSLTLNLTLTQKVFALLYFCENIIYVFIQPFSTWRLLTGL